MSVPTRLAAALLLVGCGERAVPGEPATTSSAETTTSVDTTSVDPRTVDPSSSVATAADSTGDAPSCEDLRSDVGIGPAVHITVRSESAVPVWLDSQGCFFSPVFELATGGEPFVSREDPTIPQCDQYVDYGECYTGGDDCVEYPAGRLDPGGATEGGWGGARLLETVVDPACSPDPACPTTCQRYVVAEPGIYEVSITAYRSCSGECECDGMFGGVCPATSLVELVDPITITAMIDYPTQTSVELVITDE